MINFELAKIFRQIALYLEMESVPFKPQAYERAAMILQNLPQDVAEIYKKEGIEGIKNIPGIGGSIAKKIEEYIRTGKVNYLEEYKKKIPVDIETLTSIEGIGPKMVKVLWENLKIKNIDDLEKAAKKGKIRHLPGFREKTEKNILQGIEFLKRSKGRFLLGEILPKVREIENYLLEFKEVKKLKVAGSVRRRKETIGDVDILVVTDNPTKVMDFFVSMKDIEKMWGKGETKSSVRLKEGFDVDLRVIPERCFGSALQYFTGSKEHNIKTRIIAQKKGFKLNEYGIFKGKNFIGGKTEEEVYQILGMEWIPPELRENRGEIELALEKKLPKLIELKDIKGDLHSHTKWDGGKYSIEEMAKKAKELGYEYLGISDHTKFLRIERGLDEKRLEEQKKEIEKLNKIFERKGEKFRILQGAETNILEDGSIDISGAALKRLDYAIAGVHSRFKMSKREMTKRIIKAMENPWIDIISHPTGRILKKRGGYEIDIDEILKVAKKTGTILEINANPERLDLNDINIKKAKEMGILMVINTDAHHKDSLEMMEFGIYQARRGWAEKKDILNTLPLNELLKKLKRNKNKLCAR